VIQHIDVHAVLRESVSAMYADLVTRPTGRVVRERIERAIAPADGRGDVTIARMDFTGVGCIGHGLAALLERRDGTLEALGAPEAAAALVREVLARHLAAPTSGGALALTLG